MSEKEKKLKKESSEKKKTAHKECDEKIHALQEEMKEQKDQYMRLLAEFENSRKRNERDRAEFVKYANEGVMKDFLDVVDDLERTICAAKEKHQDYEGFLKGVEMVMKHVENLLKKNGVSVLEAQGRQFDPYEHEIVMQEPTQEFDNGIVMEELQKGYRYGDRVLRTAKVKVAINAGEQNNSEENLL